MIGFVPRTSIEDGVRETVEWYLENSELAAKRYNVFYQKSFMESRV